MGQKLLKPLHSLSFLKQKRYLAVVVLAILSLVFFFPRNNQKDAITTTHPKRVDLKETVSASGELTGKDVANLHFKLAGKLAELSVKEGDRIDAGTTVAALDATQFINALHQAENDYKAKEAAALNAEDQVKGHDSDETFAQKQLRETAEAQRDSAYDEIKDAQRAINETVITTPLSGLVTQVTPVNGQVISPADVIAQVVDDSAYYFNADVDEADLSKISVGMNTEVNLNAYPDQTFRGTVVDITPQTKTTTSGATVVTTKIDLQNPPIHFVVGLNGQADIITKEVKNVLTVPLEAVRDDSTVVVKRSGKYQKVPVKTGISSDTDVEIQNGLSETDEVVTNPGAVKL